MARLLLLLDLLGLASSLCPTSSSYKPGFTYELSVPSGGLNRRFRVHVPIRMDPNKRTAIIVNLHGLFENGDLQVRVSVAEKPEF